MLISNLPDSSTRTNSIGATPLAILILVAQVQNALRFALAALDGLGLDELDVDRNLQVALELGRHTLAQDFERTDFVEREVGNGFDAQFHMVEGALGGQDDLIMRRDFRERGDNLLDLRGEDVHAAQNEHVVGAADDAVDLAVGAAARARFGNNTRKITGAVADKRAALARERGDDELAELAVGYRLERFGVDDFNEELVFGNMQAMAFGAFHRNARAHDLGKAVDVAILHAELFADFLTHGLGCRLCAQNGARKLEVLRGVIAHFDRRIGDEQRIGWRGAQDIGLEVPHELDLALGIARRAGNDHAACGFAAHMRAQTAREQAVAIRDLDGGMRAAAKHRNAAREAVAPVGQVVLRIADNGRLARGAGGCMQALDLALIDCKQTEGIGVAHILLDDERILLQIVERFDVIGVEAEFVETLLIQRDVFIAMDDRPTQTLELKSFELSARHALDFLLKIHRRLPFSLSSLQTAVLLLRYYFSRVEWIREGRNR